MSPGMPERSWEGLADLHVHTNFSDGSDSPGEVVEYALRHTRLDIIAVTDHDRIEGALLAAEHVLPGSRLAVVVGEEVSSRDGHILGLFLHEWVRPGMTAADTVAAIHAQGGIAIAAHPFWRAGRQRGRPPFGVGSALLSEVPFDAVETVNGGPTPAMWTANRVASAFARQLGAAAVGGSDAHIKQALGWSHTVFEGSSPDNLAKALRAGHVQPGTWRPDPFAIWRYLRWASGPARSRRTVTSIGLETG